MSDKDNKEQIWAEYNNWRNIGLSEKPRLNLLTTGSIW